MGLDALFTPAFPHGFLPVLSGLVVLSTLFTLVLLTLPKQYDPHEHTASRCVDDDAKEPEATIAQGRALLRCKQAPTVQIVVLGDIGRSPRMQYHALSIAKHGGRVFLIGYQGWKPAHTRLPAVAECCLESELHPDIASNPLVEIVPLTAAPRALRSSSRLLFPLIAPLKVLCQVQSLWSALGYRSPPARWMFVQNPPSIPTLAIAGLICFLRNTELVIDWHNFGYSILALKLGPSHPLVKVSALYEKLFAKVASRHITVTNAMTRVLKDDYGVTAHALHDRPASLFRPISPEERSKFLARLSETAQYSKDLAPSSKKPWRLLVSSTSWTADEDFSLLLDALTKYSAQATYQVYLPKIVAIITGKGPQKDYYLAQIRKLNQEKKLLNVVILTAWLTPEDYALLLASADLGVSLHTSSSGVDLPMKVVDMFGAGLPVVGWGKFEAWPELVQENVNGKGFDSSQQLCEQLMDLFGQKHALLKQLKQGALKESEHRWDDEWDKVGGKLFKLT
ncbi:mannosyltransferase [Pleosporales sp. CAS-2024a]